VGFFVVWRVFLCSFGVVLLLNSYWIATILLEGLVGVVSGCFWGSLRGFLQNPRLMAIERAQYSGGYLFLF
jgi:hypothetical protein